MGVIELLILLVVLGIAWHFLKPHVEPPFQQIIVVVAVVAFVLWFLRAFGLLPAGFPRF